MLLRHCFAFLLLSFPVLLQAQPARFTDTARLQKIRAALPAVEKIYRDHFEAQGFPGLAFGVVVDGQLLQSGGFGFADLEQRVPAGPASVFRIASMTKSFTALAILQLRDAGRLQLDEPAARYLPELAGLSYLTTDAAPLTVRQLLAHAAGFPEDNPWGDRQLADSEAELRKLLQDSVRFSTTPGTAYEYSNLGFALLGNIISRVSGQPYQQYIAERVLRPLGMRSTYWDFKKVPAAALAKGYRKVNGQWVAEPLLADGVWGAMGGLLTSVEDFGNYMALHLSAWPARSGEEHPVLRRSSLREMHHPWNFAGLSADYTYPDGRKTAMASAYGYGLRWTRDGNELVSVGHSGGLPGYGCQWKMYPDYGIAVVCLANGTYAPTGVANQRALDTLVALAGLQLSLIHI